MWILVRAMTEKSKFSKEKPNFTDKIFTVDNRDGYRFKIIDEFGKVKERSYKPHELYKVDKSEVLQRITPEFKKEIKQQVQEYNQGRELQRQGVELKNIIPTLEDGCNINEQEEETLIKKKRRTAAEKYGTVATRRSERNVTNL